MRRPEETIAEAQRLLDAGLPFHAHEVFEDAWKSAGIISGSAASAGSAADRGLWKGLAQIAVGLTHLSRGNNNRGAQTLLRRGAVAIDPYRQDRPYGLDVSGIGSWARAMAQQLDPLTERAEASKTAVSISWTAPRLRGGDGPDAPG